MHTRPDAHLGPYSSMEVHHLCLEKCRFCNSLGGVGDTWSACQDYKRDFGWLCCMG
jgi:hypothetical protein